MQEWIRLPVVEAHIEGQVIAATMVWGCINRNRRDGHTRMASPPPVESAQPDPLKRSALCGLTSSTTRTCSSVTPASRCSLGTNTRGM